MPQQTESVLAHILLLSVAILSILVIKDSVSRAAYQYTWMGNRSSNNKLYKATKSLTTAPMLHQKCRNTLYPRSNDVQRFHVPDEKVSWNVPFLEYKPINYTAESVQSQPVWADPEIRLKNKPILNWNTVDNKVNRKSHIGRYETPEGVPRNPKGRTGIVGRGLLGKWGPNHAADPIVTRWKRSESGEKLKDSRTQEAILQFVAIQRRDTQEWALPGGMVDVGEHVSVTCKREFHEETMNSLEASPEDKRRIEQSVTALFQAGKEIYRGYVDDPRNTDNAWMETVVYSFHDEDGSSVGKFRLHAGDDALGVCWMDITDRLKLYASHLDFLRAVARNNNAYWSPKP